MLSRKVGSRHGEWVITFGFFKEKMTWFRRATLNLDGISVKIKTVGSEVFMTV
jgi:hypothetical protein